jgi:hypothetical protein
MPADGGIADGLAEGDRKRRLKTHHLVEDGVEEGHLLVLRLVDGGDASRQAERGELLAQLRLELGHLGELVDGHGDQRGGAFVTGEMSVGLYTWRGAWGV